MTGSTVRLTTAMVSKMKLAELRQMCGDLGLRVKARNKAPFQEALHQWLEEHGEASEVVQGPQAAVKVGSR